MKTSRCSANAKSCSVWNWYCATRVLIVPHAHTQKQHCKQMNRPRATKQPSVAYTLSFVLCLGIIQICHLGLTKFNQGHFSVFYGRKWACFLSKTLLTFLSRSPTLHWTIKWPIETNSYLSLIPHTTPQLSSSSLFVSWNSSILHEALQLCKWVRFFVFLCAPIFVLNTLITFSVSLVLEVAYIMVSTLWSSGSFASGDYHL